MKKNTFYIKTFGCKVNQYESEMIRENFLKNGYVEAEDSAAADVFVVNTCTVTSTSDSKALRLIRSSLEKKKGRVAVTGCMAEDRDSALLKLKGVDFIVKNKDKYTIPDIVSKIAERSLMPNMIVNFKGHARAFVKVQDGCNNACSYCKVRVVRGRSVSRPFEEVLNECGTLIKNGYQEIVLTGICLGAYGGDVSKNADLPGLIKEICKIKGDWRLRLSSIEPKYVTEDLIAQFKTEKKLCRHLHIPFQSGDDEILKKMNRPYTVKDYIGIVTRLREAIPDAAVSTDIMTGFPGEEEPNFQNTLDFIKEIKPMRLHVFGFSKRPLTPAYNYKDSVSSFVKKKREAILMDVVKGFASEFEKAFIGKTARVLVEGKRDAQGFLQGYTDEYIKVLINGPDSAISRLLTCQLSLTNQKVYGILLSYLD